MSIRLAVYNFMENIVNDLDWQKICATVLLKLEQHPVLDGAPSCFKAYLTGRSQMVDICRKTQNLDQHCFLFIIQH